MHVYRYICICISLGALSTPYHSLRLLDTNFGASRGPKSPIKMRILQNRISGIPVILGLRTPEGRILMFLWLFWALKGSKIASLLPASDKQLAKEPERKDQQSD